LPTVGHRKARREILRPDWKASRLLTRSSAWMRGVGSETEEPRIRAINRGPAREAQALKSVMFYSRELLISGRGPLEQRTWYFAAMAWIGSMPFMASKPIRAF
jgi:hypothetical protein